LFTEFVESSLNQSNNALIAGYSITKLKSFHENDEDIGPLMQWKIDGARPFRSEIEKYSPATRHYWFLCDSLLLKNGLLFKEYMKRNGTGYH
jgi:hypothetical protein